MFRDGENGGSRVASRAAVRDCESVTELLGGGLHSGWAGPPVSSVGDHSPRDLSVFVGIRGRGARPGAPENPLMPIETEIGLLMLDWGMSLGLTI